jgi:hypothetical protein
MPFHGPGNINSEELVVTVTRQRKTPSAKDVLQFLGEAQPQEQAAPAPLTARSASEPGEEVGAGEELNDERPAAEGPVEEGEEQDEATPPEFSPPVKTPELQIYLAAAANYIRAANEGHDRHEHASDEQIDAACQAADTLAEFERHPEVWRQLGCATWTAFLRHPGNGLKFGLTRAYYYQRVKACEAEIRELRRQKPELAVARCLAVCERQAQRLAQVKAKSPNRGPGGRPRGPARKRKNEFTFAALEAGTAYFRVRIVRKDYTPDQLEADLAAVPRSPSDPEPEEGGVAAVLEEQPQPDQRHPSSDFSEEALAGYEPEVVPEG